MGYVFVFLTIAFTVYGQLIIKYEINTYDTIPTGPELAPFLIGFAFRPLVMSGLLSAVFASFAWMAALSRFDLSFAYPFMSLNFLVVVALSVFLFGESMNVYKLSGLLLICVGVAIVSFGK